MESQIRQSLYANTGLSPVFNPLHTIEGALTPLVIDLTREVCNHAEMIHPNTNEVRSLISIADAVVCDTTALSSIVKQYTTDALVIDASFGYCAAADFADEKGIRIGLLNHNDDTQMHNDANRPLLKKLKEEFLVFGKPVSGPDCEVVEDFDEFAARCDILLLPSIKNAINSITLPMSVMAAGTCVVAHNAPGLYNLLTAPGVKLIDISDSSVATWRNAIKSLYDNRRKFEQAKIFNSRAVRNISADSARRIVRLQRLLDERKEPVFA